MSLEKDFSSSPITWNSCNWWQIIFLLILQCHHCYNDPLTEEKSQNLNSTKLVDQNAEKELEKNNRNSGNDLLYSKHVIKGEKNASLHTGDQSRNNMSHNMSQPTMNNTWTFWYILLVLPVIELSWNHCLFPIVWSVKFV